MRGPAMEKVSQTQISFEQTLFVPWLQRTIKTNPAILRNPNLTIAQIKSVAQNAERELKSKYSSPLAVGYGTTYNG